MTESQRERQCGCVPCHNAGPAVQCVGRPGAWNAGWIGLVTCGHIWTCPVCSMKLRTVRLGRVLRALEAAGGRWQMVTLTVRHRPGQPLAWLLRGLAKAWRRTRQGGLLQEIWTERVSASVRAWEVTRGQAGWHPHIHALLRTSAWTDEERALLLERWLAAVERELGPECVPWEAHALRWSTPIDASALTERERARYLVKLGCEIAGDKTSRKPGTRTAWAIAEGAANGSESDAALWREYSAATRGRRMIELDDRASGFAKQFRELQEPPEREPDVCIVPIDTLEMRALREYERFCDRTVFATMLADAAKAEKPALVIQTWIDLVTRTLFARAGPCYG